MMSLFYKDLDKGHCYFQLKLMTFQKLSRIPLSAADTSQTFQSQEISQLNETINDDLNRLDL